MLVTPNQKSKVVLSDYFYQRDIENRILLATLTPFDIKVLQEVLDSSLIFPICDIASNLKAPLTEVISTLERLQVTNLLRYDESKIYVDKEMRRYYEYQIEKFEEEFTPSLEYILRGLKRIPIQVLPNWYAIPKATDDIFESLIEKYFQTSKIYRRHLLDLQLEDPIALSILEDVYSAEDFTVQTSVLSEKYALTQEQLEEYLLLLEFNFVCCASYKRVGERWQAIVTPVYEWHQLLRFRRDTTPQPLSEDEIALLHTDCEFVFLQDMRSLLQLVKQKTLSVEKKDVGWTLSAETPLSWIPMFLGEDRENYCAKIISRLLQLKLIEVHDYKLHATDLSEMWLKKRLQDQAIELHRPATAQKNICFTEVTEKKLRQVEKILRRVASAGWISFKDFFSGISEPLGEAQPIFLRKRGRRWSYVLPSYSSEDRRFLQEMIFGYLFELGVVAIGSHEENICFKVTPFGRTILGD